MSALIAAAKAGDEAAWTDIYLSHRHQVHSFLAWRTADRLLADDLTQDVFARAMRSIGQFSDDGRGLGPWLATIARNMLYDHSKRASTRMERLSVGMEYLPDGQGCAASPEDLVVKADEHARLRAALVHLSPGQREVLLLQFWQDWPMARIGRRQFQTEYAVKTMAGRGRRALRRRLEAA